jgi:hypothetical protein
MAMAAMESASKARGCSGPGEGAANVSAAETAAQMPRPETARAGEATVESAHVTSAESAGMTAAESAAMAASATMPASASASRQCAGCKQAAGKRSGHHDSHDPRQHRFLPCMRRCICHSGLVGINDRRSFDEPRSRRAP